MSRFVVFDCGTGATRILDVSIDVNGKISVYQPNLRDTTITTEMCDYAMKIINSNTTTTSATRIVIGATAWYRKLSGDQKVTFMDSISSELSQHASFISIDAEEEAKYEMEAMKYAIKHTPCLSQTRYVIGFGGGSTQISRIDEREKKDDDEDFLTVQFGTKSMPFDETKTRNQQLQDITHYIMSRDDVLKWLNELKTRNFENVIGITAAYHSSLAAGVTINTHVPVIHVLAQLNRYLQFPTHEEMKNDPNGISFRSAYWLSSILSHSNGNQIYFLRNMVVDGEPFIASWVIGYAISQKE